MRKIILAVIRSFGRYTAVLIFAITCGVGALWLLVLDKHPFLFFTLALLVIPLFMTSFALLIGVLFSGLGSQEGHFVTRADAPALWATWDEIAGEANERRLLCIDGDLNASIGERRRFAGLWGKEVTMTIGLPLLMCLDSSALRSVVAHEVGHNCHNHTSGQANIAEFVGTTNTLFEYADPNHTMLGAVCHLLFGRFLNWLDAEALALSRLQELEADSAAAASQSAPIEARANILTAAAIEFYLQEIVNPIEEELVGAIKAPAPPILRLEDRIGTLRNPMTIRKFAKIAWEKQLEPEDTHPTLRQRLESLGYTELLDVEPLAQPASEALLPPATKSSLIEKLNQEWIDEVNDFVALD